MNKHELVKRVHGHGQSGTTASTKVIVEIVIEEIVNALVAGESVVLKNNFTLTNKTRPPMTRNNLNGEGRILIPEKTVIEFSPHSKMEKRLNP